VIAQSFAIKVDGMLVPPLLVFRRSLVEFAAAVVVYKEDMEGNFTHSLAITPEKVKAKTLLFFEGNFPDLIPRLQALIHAHMEFLYWTGPQLSITLRTDQHQYFSHECQNTPAMETLQRKLSDRPCRYTWKAFG